MRSQVLAGVLAVGLLAVAPVSATVIDFSTNPNLGATWTQFPFYHESLNQGGQLTSAWNEANQNLTLTSTTSEALDGLSKTGDTRSATDGVTVTYSNYAANAPTVTANWTCAGLIVSASAAPDILDGSPWYSVYFQEDYANGLRFSVNKNLTEIGRTTLGSIPSTMKLDILNDGSALVFKANGVEICRDSTYSSASLSHYFMYWGGGAGDTLSVSADNYGVISTVPEPSSLALVVGGLLGLLAYAWRKRR